MQGEKVAHGKKGVLAVEDVYMEKPMGYHVKDGGQGLSDKVWKNPTQRKKIFDYCPELSLIMDMKLERERCEGDNKEGSIGPTDEEREKAAEAAKKKAEEDAKKKVQEDAKKAEEQARKKAEEDAKKMLGDEENPGSKTEGEPSNGDSALSSEINDILEQLDYGTGGDNTDDADAKAKAMAAEAKEKAKAEAAANNI